MSDESVHPVSLGYTECKIHYVSLQQLQITQRAPYSDKSLRVAGGCRENGVMNDLGATVTRPRPVPFSAELYGWLAGGGRAAQGGWTVGRPSLALSPNRRWCQRDQLQRRRRVPAHRQLRYTRPAPGRAF